MSLTRVLFVHPSNELYGADKVLLEVVDALPAHYIVEVWLPTDIRYPADRLRRELLARNVQVSFVDLPVLRRSYFNAKGILMLVPRLLKTAHKLKNTEFDLLYINTSALALMAPLGRRHNKPTIVHLHEYLTGLTKTVLQPLLAFSSKIICVSEAVRAALPFGSRSQSVVVYNGFDLPAGAPPTGQGKITFLLASRWNAWKGHEALLQAWAKLDRTDIELHIYGGPPEVGQSIDVESIVRRMPNRATVKIYGQIDDITEALAACDAVLVPSTNPDPLPTIAIEAAAHGRAVIASRSGGLEEIVEDGITGWLLSPGVSPEWSACLERLTAQDLSRAGVKARSRFERKFNQSTFVEKVRSVMRDFET